MTPQLPEQLELANKRNVFVSKASELVSRYRLLTNLTIIEKLSSECQSEWKKARRKGCQFLIKIPEFLAFTFYSISLFPSNCFHHLGVYHIWHKFSPSHFLRNVDLFAIQATHSSFFSDGEGKNCEYRYHDRTPDAAIKRYRRRRWSRVWSVILFSQGPQPWVN